MYHLVMTNIAMVFIHYKWWFYWENHLFPWAMETMAMLNNQRVKIAFFVMKHMKHETSTYDFFDGYD